MVDLCSGDDLNMQGNLAVILRGEETLQLLLSSARKEPLKLVELFLGDGHGMTGHTAVVVGETQHCHYLGLLGTVILKRQS